MTTDLFTQVSELRKIKNYVINAEKAMDLLLPNNPGLKLTEVEEVFDQQDSWMQSDLELEQRAHAYYLEMGMIDGTI
jgi:hypothetical protein